MRGIVALANRVAGDSGSNARTTNDESTVLPELGPSTASRNQIELQWKATEWLAQKFNEKHAAGVVEPEVDTTELLEVSGFEQRTLPLVLHYLELRQLVFRIPSTARFRISPEVLMYVGAIPDRPIEAKLAAGKKTDTKDQPSETASDSLTPKKPKHSTERGEGRAKLIAALTKHHKYADGSCLNLDPSGNNELARLAKVSESTASAFFKKQFGGHTK